MILTGKKLFLNDNKDLLAATVLIISFIIAIIYACLLLYYGISWNAITNYELRITDQPIGGAVILSVIIPARNEEKNIRQCLDSLINQSYSSALYEVIVVDDHSEDNTAAVIRSYSHKNVRLISLKDHVTDRLNSYKKKAIETAISQAKGKLIVTTDADCIAPVKWLQTIADFYEEQLPAFIAMPVAVNEQNRFIEIFQSLDFMTLQGITGAVVSKKQMTMCNGANMAYERDAFFEVNGFTGIDDLASGDDMLLMNKISKRYPDRVLFLKSTDVIIQTEPVHTTAQFMNQRIRWASKSDKYDDKRILPVLLLVYLFNCLLIALPVIAIFNNNGLSTINCQLSTISIWLILLIIKTVAELIFLFPVAKFFSKKRLLFWFPFMQPFHIIYTVIAGWLGKFGSYQWKGRNVN